ncbi:MAG: right-handed parallel beta-helix repeat-containing protein, partial [Candidatus Thermoplasmatota archaeon]
VSVIWHTTNIVGYHTIIAVADAENKIDELNETNNELSKKICILTVEFCINSTIIRIIQLKSFITSILLPTDANKINKHLDKVIDELEEALEEYNEEEKELKDVIKDLNHAVDESWKAVEEANKLWDQNKLTESDAKNIINSISLIVSSIIETCYVTLCINTAKDITKVENIIIQMRVRYIFEELSDDCKKVDEKLANAYQHYQKAMEALAEEKSAWEEIEQGYDKLLEAKEDVSDLVKKGKLSQEFGNWVIGKINKAILVFPPNLKITPYDIIIQGPMAKGYKTKITITVYNVGVVFAKDVKIEIYQMTATALISSFTVPKIKAGESITKTVDWTPTVDGTHDIKVVLDPENKIVEPVKEDNVVSSGVYILSVKVPPRTEQWNITGLTIVIDQYVVWENGVDINDTYLSPRENNVTIFPNGYLILINSNLTIVCQIDGQYKIEIQQGGRLDVLNGSLVTGIQYPGKTFRFEVHGNLNIKNQSRIEKIYGDVEAYPYKGGVQLYPTAECLIENSTIRWSETHNIYCDGASPKIINSTISRAGIGSYGSGVYCVNATMLSVENSIVNESAQYGVVISSSISVVRNSVIKKNTNGGLYYLNCLSLSVVENCSVENSATGICVNNSSVTTRNSSIMSNTNYGLYAEEALLIVEVTNFSYNNYGAYLYRSKSNTTFRGNTFFDCDCGLSVENSLGVDIAYNFIEECGTKNEFTLLVVNTSTVNVLSNTISNNYCGGVWLVNSSGTIANNTITNNWEYHTSAEANLRPTPGIGVWSGTWVDKTARSYLIIDNNTINGNTHGIFCGDRSYAKVTRNTLIGNEGYYEVDFLPPRPVLPIEPLGDATSRSSTNNTTEKRIRVYVGEEVHFEKFSSGEVFQNDIILPARIGVMVMEYSNINITDNPHIISGPIGVCLAASGFANVANNTFTNISAVSVTLHSECMISNNTINNSATGVEDQKVGFAVGGNSRATIISNQIIGAWGIAVSCS